MNEKALTKNVGEAGAQLIKPGFSSVLHFMRGNPITALAVVGVTVGVAYFLSRQGFFKNNKVIANKDGLEFNPEHTTNIENKDIHSGKATDLLSLGSNPQIKTGNIQSGEDSRLQAIDSDTKTEVINAVAQLRNNT